jgi:alcohol dehydrogenase
MSQEPLDRQKGVLAAVAEKPGVMTMREFPLPSVGPDDGLLRVEVAGVCGTDPKSFLGKIAGVSFPVILGHEIVGTIESVGERAVQKWGVTTGDRVVVESCITCGACPDCLEGEYRTCRQLNGYGLRTGSAQPPHLFGAFAQYMYLAPGSVLHRVPRGLSPEVAVFGPSALANGIEWTGIGDVGLGDVIVVQGVGQQGLFCCLAARERGAELIIAAGLARDRRRLDAALRFGAHRAVDVEEEDLVEVVGEATGGDMADVVMEVSGSARASRLSLDLVRQRGRIVLCGLLGQDVEVALPLDRVIHKQITVSGALSRGANSVRESLRILASGKYDFQSLISHRYPLEEAELALQVTAGDLPAEEPVKVLILPNG